MSRRGRRASARMCALAFLAASTLAAATAAADPVPPATTTFSVPNQAPASVPVAGTDGATWSLAYERLGAYETPSTLALDRFGSDGLLSRAPLPSALAGDQLRTRLTPLADGTMAAVLADQEGYEEPDVHVQHMTLVRFGTDGHVAATTELPQQSRRAYGFAIAQDGTVWFARACADALYRRGPGGHLTRFALDHVGCGTHPECEASAGLTIAPDGAVWYANPCQGRVERVALDGAVRTWRPARSEGEYSYDTTIAQTVLATDPNGGIVWLNNSLFGGDYSGRVTAAGRVVHLSAFRSGAFVADDGTVWDGAQPYDENGARLPAGSVPAGATAEVSAQARDGSIWAIAGQATLHQDEKVPYTTWSDSQVVNFGDGGAWALPVVVADSGANVFSLGPDGALWAPFTVAPNDGSTVAFEMTRILPADVTAPRAPTATIVKRLTRVGRTAWLQLYCDAELGRYCTGSATLASAALVQAPARFVTAGQSRGAVALQLSAKAATRLRRGALHATVRVQAQGAALTRKAIALPGMKHEHRP